jgi:hypothetical protein
MAEFDLELTGLDRQDLELLWQQLESHVVPFELDRHAYRSTKYHRPVLITMNPNVWRRVVRSSSIGQALDIMLMLGFVPVASEDIVQWAAAADENVDGIKFQCLHQDPTPAASPSVAPRQVTFEDPPEESPSHARVRELESEVRELTRQLRLLKSREAVEEPESATPPVPCIISKSLVASTNGSLVCLRVSYLDPDGAPYVVSLSAHTGRLLVPCTVVEHRFVLFVAPPHPRGSLAITLLCTVEGVLRRYTRSVWLEYRPYHETKGGALSHHAVNQLIQEIPLPSSATLAEPSEVTEFKSEAASTFDDNETDATSDNGSTAGTECHLPLTKEMLEMMGANSSLPVPVAGRRDVGPHSEWSEAEGSMNRPFSTVAESVDRMDPEEASVRSVRSVGSRPHGRSFVSPRSSINGGF